MLSYADKQSIVDEFVNRIQGEKQTRQAQRGSTHAQRQASQQKLAAKGEALMRLVQTQAGLRKIAADLANPVRYYMDYKAIARQLVVVEQIPDGVPMIYDKDQPKVPAVIVGESGMPRMIEMIAYRNEVTPFEIIARPKLPYRELYLRRFKALDRLKDRLIEGIDLREDLKWFSLIEAASEVINTKTNVTGKVYKDDLADAMYQVERHRLPVTSMLADPKILASLRSWQFLDLDQAGLQEIREMGYLGNFFGVQWYISDQVTTGRAYCLAPPKFLGWQPIRKDTEIIPADDPDNAWLGFVGYLYEGMELFGTYGVSKIEYTG